MTNERRKPRIGSSSYTDEDSEAKRMKRKGEKTKCGYCIGSHHEKYFFRRILDIMTKILEYNNIDVLDFARREEGKLSLEQEDCKRLYALGSRFKIVSHIYVSYIFVSDLQYYISYSETSIPSLEETPKSSPRFPPKNSHFH